MRGLESVLRAAWIGLDRVHIRTVPCSGLERSSALGNS
jgi:hypothetical protein